MIHYMMSHNNKKIHKIAIFGFGGRCVNLLEDLYDHVVGTSTLIQIVAIYDDFYNTVFNQLSKERKDKITYFFQNQQPKIYKEDRDQENGDQEDGQEEKLYLENEFDLSFISNQNYKHYKSIQLAMKYGKNIFCEKPLVTNLKDLVNLKSNDSTFFQTGLTLRYSKMASIVMKHLPKIGKLHKVYGREFVNIGHGVHIMSGWRRYKNLSGGMGLEKAVHDYDLLLYWMNKSFGIDISNIEISGSCSRNFWTKENEGAVMDKLNVDPELMKCYRKWETRIHQTLVASPFDDLDNPNIIPDYQEVSLKFLSRPGLVLDFAVSVRGFRTKTERMYEFIGSEGKIIIDVINSKMTFLNRNLELCEVIDLEGDGSSHSNGDTYVVQTLLDLLNGRQPNESAPSFDDAIRSTHIGLLCEKAIEENKSLIFN